MKRLLQRVIKLDRGVSVKNSSQLGQNVSGSTCGVACRLIRDRLTGIFDGHTSIQVYHYIAPSNISTSAFKLLLHINIVNFPHHMQYVVFVVEKLCTYLAEWC